MTLNFFGVQFGKSFKGKNEKSQFPFLSCPLSKSILALKNHLILFHCNKQTF